jgi:uncharacterized protein YndB with AHSA1/START domain
MAVVLGVVVVRQPTGFRIVRSAVIAASPAQVFAQVNDLHNWEAWSPWLTPDPAARTAFEGPRAGAGAVFTWSGNRHVGEGRMTIVESRPHELVRLRLDFKKPFQSTCTAEFVFAAEGDRTVVEWSMSGENNLVAKAVHLVMDMDRMIGGNFEKGLAQMKAIAETTARKG